ncbi:MAG TPA: hypothetical protein VGO43_09505 [Pyrinomonadaceae bacterium]|jgi:hypothetical protein|nr:hypothetical protein [Pyrinomonadaceae bacterium]
MSRILPILLIVYSLLTATLTPPVMTQQVKVENAPADGVVALDLKKSIVENNNAFLERSSKVDVKALDKIDRQTPKKKGWISRHKLAFVAIVVGFAALIFVAVKYGKDCIKSEPEGCTPNVDENCTCTQYAQNL